MKIRSTLMILGLLLLLSAASWGVVVVDENFDSYAPDSLLVGQGGWILGGGGGTNLLRIADVCPATCPEPEMAGCWQSPPGTQGTVSSNTKNTFPVVWSQGVARLYISLKFDATTPAGGGGNVSYIQIFGTDGEVVRIYMNRSDGVKGNIKLLGKSGSSSGSLWQPILVQDPANDVWYHIKLEVDAANRKYDAYLGDGDRFGSNEGHWTRIVDDLYFYYAGTNLASVCWTMYHRGDDFIGPAKFYVDNLYIDGPDTGDAVRGTEVWVAEGTCREEVKLAPYVSLYGGFAGTERNRGQRNGTLNPTIIDPGDTTKNAVTGAAMSRIDGFIIKGANNGIDASASPPVVTNNIITGNTGAGVVCGNGTAGIRNNTIVSNATGVSVTAATPDITNNIIASNNTGVAVSGGTPALSHNDVFNNATNYSGTSAGNGDISADALFTDASAGNYHLAFGSPCIEAGSSAVDLRIDYDGASRPADGDGDGSAVIDMGALESQFVPGLRLLRLVKREGDRAIVRIDGAVITAVWPNYFYVESDDRVCGIRVQRPGHTLTVGSRANAAGTLRTDENGERYVDAVVARANGLGTVEPIMLSGRPLGGGDYWFQWNGASGAGQIGSKAWYWVVDPTTKKPIREFGSLRGLNNMGLLVRVFGKVTWSEGNAFVLNDGSGYDDYETTDEASAPGGVKAVLPIGTSAPAKGEYVQVTGISSCYRQGDDIYRLLRVPDGGVVTLSESPPPPPPQ